MKQIQQRINSLKPYVISFRFQDGMSIVDAVFKEGWHVPQSEVIQSQKGDSDELNYHMFFSQEETIGIDEILDYIEKVIGLNIEREKKHELLKIKAKELQELFRKHPLSKLENMKFVLTSEKLVPNMEPDDLDVVDFDIETPIVKKPEPEPVKQPSPEPVNNQTNEVVKDEPNVMRAPNGEIIPPLPPEDTGELEDEFKKYDLTDKDETVTKQVGNRKIDLPPKNKKTSIELAEIDGPKNIVCKCSGPEDICPACEEEKLGAY